jgi:thiamine biosynthesis lipoprotein
MNSNSKLATRAKHRRARPLLGTFVEIGLHDGDAAVFSQAFEKVEHVQRRMSAHSADSDLAEISRYAHQRWVTVDAATAEVIRLSLQWAALSDGAFDPVRAGVALIHSGRRPAFTDEAPDLAATWRDVELNGLQIRATRPLAVDLGGVAKGYAVDLAAKVIESHGGSGVVNAGGDLRFIGSEQRTVSLRKPDAEGALLELREIPFPALATTASYAFSDEGGNLDLIGGEVSPAGISITVFAENCALADAMTKAVLNLPRDQAAQLLQSAGCCALILEADGSYHELP